MTNDSLEILWRGADPAKFTALQAALRDDGIQFWHTQVYDPAGGFLSSRPYYLDQRVDVQEQYRAIGWVRHQLYSVIFEVREDAEGDYFHLVTLWKASREERELYEEHT